MIQVVNIVTDECFIITMFNVIILLRNQTSWTMCVCVLVCVCTQIYVSVYVYMHTCI